MTITNVAPIPRARDAGDDADHHSPATHFLFFLLQRARPPSPLPRATNIPAAGVVAASPTAGETRRRRRQSPLEGSPTRT